VGAPRLWRANQPWEARLRFSTKIVLSLSLIVAFAAGLSYTLLTFLKSQDEAIREVSHSYEQTLVIQEILSVENDYSEQLAELFVLGTDDVHVKRARDELLSAIDAVAREVREEIAELRRMGEGVDVLAEIAAEDVELERLDELRGLVDRIEGERGRIVTALAAGRSEQAKAIYRDEVENRFDALLDRRLDVIVSRERDEVIEALGSLEALSERMRAMSYVLVLATFLASAVFAVFLRASVLRPVLALTRGTEAVAGGELHHEVRVRSTDELGLLASRFNAMTATVRLHRDALQSAKQNLELQVQERTSELREVATRHREIAERRSRVLADLSHELRTPLTVVRGKAEVTLRDPSADAPGMRAALERILMKAEQMSRLVDDMLFVARSEAGELPVERSPVALQDILADVLLDSRELSRRKDIAILPRQSTEPIDVMADAGRLRQAILIVLDNAVRVAPAGSTVGVTLGQQGGRARIVVSDEGPGFAAEEAERAFSRFWRGKGTRGGAGRGIGLGLSIAHWIMKVHDGTIQLENLPDGGATVRLEMPVNRPADASSGIAA